jgi:hypothetical protein
MEPVTPRDIFGLVLRLTALWIFVWGCWQLSAAVAMLWRTLQALIDGTILPYTSFNYAVYGLPAVAGSVLVLRFADGIVDFTYRR